MTTLKKVEDRLLSLAAVSIRSLPAEPGWDFKPISVKGKTSADGGYTILRAKYVKGGYLIQTPSTDGFKTRAARLLEVLKCRYSNREKGYIATNTKADKFRKLYADGWDATPLLNKLIPPKSKL